MGRSTGPVPGMVGGAHDPAPAPRDEEQHPPGDAHGETARRRDASPVEDDVDAHAGHHRDPAGVVRERSAGSARGPGRVDDTFGGDPQLGARHEVRRLHTGRASVRPLDQARGAYPCRQHAPARDGGAGDRDHQPRVVLHPVPIREGAAQPLGAQRRYRALGGSRASGSAGSPHPAGHRAPAPHRGRAPGGVSRGAAP